MPAPAISHLICTTALVTLIFMMPFFSSMVLNDISSDMEQRELKEIADYVSNTFGNLYFLVNSTGSSYVSLEKEMIYLPSSIENAIYVLKIVDSGGNASKVTAYLKGRTSTAAEAWLLPGLKVIGDKYSVESGGKTVVVGCTRDSSIVSIWITYADAG